jgi:hypothetical protein
MDLKHILNPESRKVVLMIILLSLPFFISATSFALRPFNTMDRVLVLTATKSFGANTPLVQLSFGVFGILDSLYVYAICCFIVATYERLRKR